MIISGPSFSPAARFPLRASSDVFWYPGCADIVRLDEFRVNGTKEGVAKAIAWQKAERDSRIVAAYPGSLAQRGNRS